MSKSNKATLSQVEELHNLVAEELSAGLDDPKKLSLAIAFLKNNNITVDLQESKEVQNIFETVNNLVDKEKDKDSVDTLLEDISLDVV